MKSKFKQWQWVICTHYKNRPKVQITDIVVPLDEGAPIEIWVEEETPKRLWSWWGPESWFKAIPKRKKRKPLTNIPKHDNNLPEGGLCDNNLPGCTCNQWSSVGD